MKKAFIVYVMLLLASCGFEYSDGSRVGMLYKISKKGFVCKTWEGILKTGFTSSNKAGMMVAEEFRFSVESEEVAKQLEGLQGKQVELQYIQKLFNPPCSPSSAYRIQSAKEVQ